MANQRLGHLFGCGAYIQKHRTIIWDQLCRMIADSGFLDSKRQPPFFITATRC